MACAMISSGAPVSSGGTVSHDGKDLVSIVIGSDHGGFEMRRQVATYLRSAGHKVDEVGPQTADRVDYPDVAVEVCDKLRVIWKLQEDGDASIPVTRGILICGTGIGISIAANKLEGIRCALCHDHYTAVMSREHNDANVLALGGRVLGPEVALDAVRAFLATPFMGSHHTARLSKIAALESRQTETSTQE